MDKTSTVQLDTNLSLITNNKEITSSDTTTVDIVEDATSYKRLEILWNKFQQCQNEDIKVNLLERFIYEYNKLIKKQNATSSGYSNSNKYRSLSNVASQLTCYLLQLVHGIICSSVELNAEKSETRVSTPNRLPVETTTVNTTDDDDRNCNNINISLDQVDFKTNINFVTGNFINNNDYINYNVENHIGNANGSRQYNNYDLGSSKINTPMMNDDCQPPPEHSRNDLTTIVALRTFLISGIGGRILEILQKLDTRNMLCSRELANLLVNLFPTNCWDNNDSAAIAVENIEDFDTLEMAIRSFESAKKSRRRVRLSSHASDISDKKNDEISLPAKEKLRYNFGWDDETSGRQFDDIILQSDCSGGGGGGDDPFDDIIENYDLELIKLINHTNFTSDYIGSIVLNLMGKLVTEEYSQPIKNINNNNFMINSTIKTNQFDRNSVTLTCFNFAVDGYCSIGQSITFRPVNQEILQRRLLTIIYSCLRNVFIADINIRYVLNEYFNLPYIFNRLLQNLSIESQQQQQQRNNSLNGLCKEYNQIKYQHISSSVYLLFLILYKSFIHQHEQQYPNYQQHQNNNLKTDNNNLADMNRMICLYHKLFDIVKPNADILTKSILKFIVSSNGKENTIISLTKLLRIIFKLICWIRSMTNELEDIISISSTISKTRNKKSTKLLSKKTFQQLCFHHHENTHELGCILERIILNVAEQVQYPEHLLIIMKFFHRNAICCCNIKINNLKFILIRAQQLGLHKECLKFIKENSVKTIYSNVDCLICDKHKNDYNFENEFVELYKLWLNQLNDIDKMIFLKHIAKISKYLQFDMASKVFVDVVLPEFRQQKLNIINHLNDKNINDDNTQPQQQKQQQQEHIERSLNKEIIIHCLNIFLCYLRDIRLIKGFFNDENIQHLEDLILYPEFASLVCCLLKIGLENVSFLGENCGDQKIISKKLNNLKINSVIMTTEVLINLFDTLNEQNIMEDISLKHFNTTADTLNEFNCLPNRIIELVKTQKLSIKHILHLAIVYWNMILQLIRRSSSSSTSISTSPISPTGLVNLLTIHQTEALKILIYNSLSCFLYTPPSSSSPSPPPPPPTRSSSHEIFTDESSTNIYVYEKSTNDVDNLFVNNIDVSSFKPHSILETHSTTDNNYLNEIVSSVNLETVPSFLSDTNSTGSSFNYIFDVRNQSITLNSSDIEKVYHTTENNYDKSNNGLVSYMISSGISSVSIVQNVIQFISTRLFANTTTADANNYNSKCSRRNSLFSNLDQLTVQLFNDNEYKKLFLQLFEITCGVMMSLNDNAKTIEITENRKNDSKMVQNHGQQSQSLQELQTILLRHSLKINDTNEKGTTIISALQSLLKIAEMRYKCCFVENCAHATYYQSISNNQQDSSSIPASLKHGGDNQCCSAEKYSDLDAYGLTNDVEDEFSSDIEQTENEFGGSSSEEYYLTADDGYDGDGETANFTGETDNDDINNEDNDHRLVDLINPIINQSMPPSSRYRNHIVHEEICRIVIDILIELSKRCLKEPDFWPKYLMQIVVRFTAIRDSIGGSLYLIKGFKPILECNDERLRDFQKAILELITDVENPECLVAYLSILTGDNPPINLLLPRLIYMGGFSHRLQPYQEIRFPTLNDDSINTTCDPVIFKEIKQIYDYHQSHNLETVFTRSTYIVPLNYLNFNPWSQRGFTISSWIQMQCERGGVGSSSSNNGSGFYNDNQQSNNGSGEFNDSTLNSSTRNPTKSTKREKVHLFSIGTNKLMLSIYVGIHDSSTLYCQLSRPDSQMPDKKLIRLLKNSLTTESVDSGNDIGDNRGTNNNLRRNRSPCGCTLGRKSKVFPGKIIPLHKEVQIKQKFTTTTESDGELIQEYNKENINDDNLDTSLSSTSTTTTTSPPTRTATSIEPPSGLNVLSSSYQTAIKNTKIALRNSFSQFNLFSSSSTSDNDGQFQSFRYPIEVKGIKLQKNKWSHLGISVQLIGKEMMVKISIDGLDQHTVSLPCSQYSKNDKHQFLCIGEKLPLTKHETGGNEKGIKISKDNLTMTNCAYSLANIKLFKKCVTNDETLAGLVTLGPNCTNLTSCQIRNILPNLGYLNSNKCDSKTLSTDFGDIIKELRENLIGSFLVNKSTILLGYKEQSNVGEPMGLIRFGSGPIIRSVPTFQSAIILSGGLSTLLYLFARVVELSTSEQIQSSALSFLLRTSHTNSDLYTEFRQKDYCSLIGPIIKSPKCIKGIYLLNAILEVACDYPVLSKRGDQFYVNTGTHACIIYADLLVSIIYRYSDWHMSDTINSPAVSTNTIANGGGKTIREDNNKSSEVIEILLATLQALVREKHPKQNLNIARLTRAGLVSAVLHFCKFYLVGIPQPVQLTNQAADSLVNLVSIFAGAPPTAAILDDVIKVLLLLHRPSDSFVTHDRTKFYFLLSSVALVKQKRLSLPPLSTRKLSLSIKPRKKATVVNNFRLKSTDEESITTTNHELNQSTGESETVVTEISTSTIDKSSNCSGGGIDTASGGGGGGGDMITTRKTNDANYMLEKIFSASLDTLVDYSRDCDRKAFNRICKVGEIARIDKVMAQQLQHKQRHILGKKRIVKRTRHRTKSRSLSRTTTDDSENDRPPLNLNNDGIVKSHHSESGYEEDSSSLVQEYDIIASDDIRKLYRLSSSNKISSITLTTSIKSEVSASLSSCSTTTTTTSTTTTTVQSTLATTSDGVIQIQMGLFSLLKDFILILPDNLIQEVLSHYVTVDIILVMANHHDANVRAAIVYLVCHICQRLSESASNTYHKLYYWHHLGNQIALHPANQTLIQACCQWITGSYLSLEQIISETNIKVIERIGLNVLIASLPQTVHEINLMMITFQFLQRLYGTAGADQRQYMIECGLLPAVTKSLSRFYVKFGTNADERSAADIIQNFLTTIAIRAILASGTINILWDLLNGLSFAEENKNITVLRGFRSTGAIIMNQLLQTFSPINKITTSNSKYKFNIADINLINSTLPSTEKKTRFDLLIDRIVQFITNVEPSHVQTDAELRLIENIILLSFSGCSRGCSVVPWALCPSRPMSLKVFTIRSMYNYSCSRNSSTTVVPVACDGKMVKTMVQSFFLTDREIIPTNDLDILKKVCKLMGILHTSTATELTVTITGGSSTGNLSHTLEKLESMRETNSKDQKSAIERTVYRFESIVQTCIDSAMKITRDVVELQNVERRILMNQMRAYDESGLAEEWKCIIDRMTHEGGPWHCSKHYSKSWRLDETEGPTKSRVRLKRCRLQIENKFLMPTAAAAASLEKPSTIMEPLNYLKLSLIKRPHYPLNDQLLYTFACRHLPIDDEIDGEMIVTESHLIFLANDLSIEPINLEIVTINDIWLRRYQHRDTGLEFCMDTNTSILFIFQETGDRQILVKYFADKIVDCTDEMKLSVLVQHWREGQLTNWEYLMALNQISGRTYQDLMQYPIFPWILAEYEQFQLNLLDSSSFRKFGKPIAVQHKDSEQHYINNYNYLKQVQMDSGSSSHMLPYHYGSHYSNSGTVLHFLVRIPPFTNFFLKYQDNNFDIPDRTFHSLSTTWRLASKDSPTDVKELIPEFFTLPEIFENFESFKFGCRQSGEPVDHVALPPWASNSSRQFVLIHRQALESQFVRNRLHKWIDLIFGYKQTGEAAEESINVFHPATYIGFSTTGVHDPIVKKALETMVRTYGQMPRQLFNEPHPEADLLPQPLMLQNKSLQLYPYVKGLRWGIYTGSPELSDPRVACFYQSGNDSDTVTTDDTGTTGGGGGGSLLVLMNTNVCYAVPSGCNVMQGSEPDTMNLVSWNEPDGVIRIGKLSSDQPPSESLIYQNNLDVITCCGTDPNTNQLWLGHKSGKLTVHQCYSTVANRFNKNRWVQHTTAFNKFSYNSAFRRVSSKDIPKTSTTSLSSDGNNDLNSLKWKEPVILVKHTNQVTNIHLSKEFKIAVSVSQDGSAAIWDINRLLFIRCIQRPSICSAPISLVAVSPTLGDIFTVHSIDSIDGETGGQTERNIINSSSIESNNSSSNNTIYDGGTINKTILPSDCFEVTEDPIDEDDFVNVPIDIAGKSLMRLHTINGKYVNHVIDSDSIKACCYSYIKEGTGINVIATGYANGVVRMWASWDLSLVKEIHIGQNMNICSLIYSTYQHLVILTTDNVIQVWETDGLTGTSPKFPQILYNKRKSV